MEITQLGRALFAAGLLLAVAGALLTLAGGVPLLGRLPGDLRFGDDRWTVYVPIGTSILLSVLLTLAFGAASWLGGRR